MILLCNLKQFATKNRLIFSLFLLCQISAVLILFFSMGVYQNYSESKIQDQKKPEGLFDERTGEEYDKDDPFYLFYEISYKNSEDNPLRAGTVKAFYRDLLNCFPDKLDGFGVICTFYLDAIVFPDEEFDENKVDAMQTYINFSYDIKNGKLTNDSAYEEYKSLGWWKSGRWFTDEECISDKKVCVADIRSIKENPLFDGKLKYNKKNKKYYLTLNNIKYEVIGELQSADIIKIPFEAVDDNFYVIDTLTFKLNTPLTKNEFAQIKQLYLKYFSDRQVELPNIAVSDAEQLRFYNTNLIIAIVVAILVSINLILLFKYVLMTRRKELAILRITGATINKVRRLYVLETMIISIILFIFSACIFDIFIKDIVLSHYEYAYVVYSLKNYCITFLLYILVIYIILNILIYRHIKKTPISLLKGGETI